MTMFETARLLAADLFYLLTHLLAACVHLAWNRLPTGVAAMIGLCFSNSSSPILMSMLKLHCLMMVFFLFATCFRLTTAKGTQHVFVGSAGINHTLNFDELSTDSSGFGKVPDAYHHLNFDGLYPFNPRAEALEGKISKHDLNCAVSAPNSLYGARFQNVRSGLMKHSSEIHDDVPGFHVDTRSTVVFRLHPYFTLHSLKIKPLDIPLSHTTLYLKGYTSEQVIHWEVEFPLGFHDMFHAKMEEYSRRKWEKLEKLEIFANLHYDGGDWEFCLDDMDIEFHSILDSESVRPELGFEN